ncbi:DNA repair-scaffolding protein isoform X2 [Hemicordylus capensis]|uniref:DNA repair-scaffolding protein isoform X2 n=1 Tax=Hemicordylus capensis TaxID=884348 RepID=UPI00230432D3|nr:DNA repair-scaffolding protein isoform X2 [Hemicordylus capensis]
MPTRKRKRTWYTDLASFPDEKPIGEGKVNSGEAVDAAAVSSAWLHCGDGFQTTSSLETSGSSEKPSRVKKCFASLLSSIEGISKSESSSEFTDIVWSSSESDFSDDENKALTSRRPCLKVEKYRKYERLNEDEYNEGEPQFIDWENDSDYQDDAEQYSGSKTDGTPLDISDTDSCTNSNFMPDKEKEDEYSKTVSAEISEYSSGSENLEESKIETTNLEFPKNIPAHFGRRVEMDTGISASDWLKSAQALLQTPKKKADKSLRTPEDSAKKRKLLRGGLAERLNRLQNRKRAAISFWRHQCISDDQTASGSKSGVLIVKILEIHEECTLYIALCHQLGQMCGDNSSAEEIADPQPKIKVLFAKETAAHLRVAPQDVIHVHPPWQKLLLDENVPVIINTYFSQKVIFKETTEMDRPHFQEPLLTKRNISLAQILSLSDVKNNPCQASEVNQFSYPDMKTSKAAHSHSNNDPKLFPFAITFLSDSLLDVVETQGTARGRGMQVRVVVQRVYYLPAKEVRCRLQENNLAPNTAPFLNSDLPNVRLCFLIQDVYGIFSEVQFQDLFSSPEEIEECSQRWEGKCCHLTGMKILQRLTRGSMLGLFSLIDSLWPPVLPLKVPGRSQENEMHVTANLPPPGFCYILAAHPEQRHIEADETEQISNLYFPPVVHNLKEILQMRDLNQCCSFWAYVIYRRLQVTGSTLSQRQFWLFVTDSSLQNETEISPGTPKTLPISIASSCVVDGKVMEALNNTSPCVIFFKDALCGNGRIICVERTVLLLQKPLLCSAAGSDIMELTGPVKLDELDSATQVNSICTVRGTVSGVNERTAVSWPTCNRCGNGKVEQHPQDSCCKRQYPHF